MSEHRFPFKWYLKDGYPAKGISKNGLKVFSCFACGGGSTMGYKLAGFTVLGCNEIDPEIIEVYKANHNPQFAFNEDIRKFRERDDLPEELFNLDILDGSPPCSTFSTAGNREKDWGKEKHFREGQAKQRLDDLFFEFIALARKLKPKVVISENVTGMLKGNAKGYIKEIFKAFDDAGYSTQLFQLNASTMGVPQKRERVFFISQRKDMNFPKLRLSFNEKGIPLYKLSDIRGRRISETMFTRYYRFKEPQDTDLGKIALRQYGKPSCFNAKLIHNTSIVNTIASATGSQLILHSEPYLLSANALKQVGTFPMDYNFLKVDVKYLIGMSVPPVMTAQIANEIYKQWFKGINAHSS